MKAIMKEVVLEIPPTTEITAAFHEAWAVAYTSEDPVKKVSFEFNGRMITIEKINE